ncbi:hypothetical protein HYR69_07360, partial [Candidatus Sumerlaeota bacterium]|nr:hypothetical protein [Candidatus Sumerlaeota bacterium]
MAWYNKLLSAVGMSKKPTRQVVFRELSERASYQLDKRPYVCKPWFDISAELAGHAIKSIDVGFDGRVYVLMDVTSPNILQSLGLQKRYAYRILVIGEDAPIRSIIIPPQNMDFCHSQPLPDGDLLLADSRSSYRGPGDWDMNGRIFSPSGETLREILLGDGIANIQADENGIIWTGYFDEGVYGNLGWKEPVGRSGLVAWDPEGNKRYEFAPPEGQEPIHDCYALNVASASDVWICYYSEFPLIRLQNRKPDLVFEPPVGGSNAFAISEKFALFEGGYNRRYTYVILRFTSEKSLDLVRWIEPANESGELIKADWVTARGKFIYLMRDGLIYRLDAEA